MAEPLRFWSVTMLTKLALGEGPGLIYWKLNHAAECGVLRSDYVQRMRREDGDEAAIKYVREASNRASGLAKGRGTAAHTAIEAFALGQSLPPMDAQHLPYAEQFIGWAEKHRPEFLMAEAPVYNPQWQYAGTLDGIMRLYGRRLLYDVKTTEHGPYALTAGGKPKQRPPFPEVALQLCAYSRCPEVGVLSEQRYASGQRYYLYDQDVPHEPLPEVDGAICIVVSPEDCFAVPVRITEDTWQTWLAVLRVAAFRVRGAHDLFGPVLPDPDPVTA